MKDFDAYIKECAKEEKIHIPLHTTQAINKKIREIELDKKRGSFIKLKRRTSILIAIGIVTLGGVVLASDLPQKLINGISQFFQGAPDAKYVADAYALRELEQSVGIAIEKQGIKVQIDSIALDDNFLNIFYTMYSKEIISKPDEYGNAASLYVPQMKLKIDNALFEYMNNGQNTDAYLENEYTLKVMERINVAHLQLPEEFELEIDLINPCEKEGEWIINVPVKKLEAPSKIIQVDEFKQINTITPFSNHPEEEKGTFDICVEKVILSPLASQIVISERNVGDELPFSNFALFDQDGNSLEIITQWAGISGERKEGESRNGFEFIAPDNLEKLILVPTKFHRMEDKLKDGITYGEKLAEYEDKYPNVIEFPIEQIPCEIQRGPLITYSILSLETNQDTMTVRFKIKGVAKDQVMKTDIFLLDDKGKFMFRNAIKGISIDRETGIYTLRITNAKKDDRPVDFNKAKYFTIDDGGYLLPEEILWDQAIEIDLSK